MIEGRDTLIMTHGDTDGICASAIIKSMHLKSEIFFSHPHGILDDLNNNIKSNITRVYILDIALDESIWRRLIEYLNRLSRRVDVVYIDHHPRPKELDIEEIKFRFFHEEDRSTSELTYMLYQHLIDKDLSRVALFGAIGDYSDETQFVRYMYDRWDKRHIYFEGGLLTYALEASRKLYDFKRRIAELLSNNMVPSSSKEVVERALKMAETEEKMRLDIKDKVKSMENIAYVINVEGSIGRAARYAMVFKNKPVGIAIEIRNNKAIMSVRARKGYVDLNTLLRNIAIKFNGSGGGHPHAAGARIPLRELSNFLKHLDKIISNSRK
jgi:RecJ-like exonuclease